MNKFIWHKLAVLAYTLTDSHSQSCVKYASLVYLAQNKKKKHAKSKLIHPSHHYICFYNNALDLPQHHSI
jgi:hypothetical protein